LHSLSSESCSRFDRSHPNGEGRHARRLVQLVISAGHRRRTHISQCRVEGLE
jgi:hypothetical protein